MYAISLVLIILISIFTIIVVLLQPGKGDLTATFGGISSQFGSMFGMQKTKNILTTTTKFLVGALFILALIVNRFFVGSTTTSQQAVKPVTEGAKVPAGNIAPPPVKTMPEAQPKQK
jgi:protein translocase SecG subunit